MVGKQWLTHLFRAESRLGMVQGSVSLVHCGVPSHRVLNYQDDGMAVTTKLTAHFNFSPKHCFKEYDQLLSNSTKNIKELLTEC